MSQAGVEYILRNAFLTDSIHYFNWVNDAEVRKGSNNSELVEWETHNKWFKKSVNDPNKMMLMFVEKNPPHTPIGQVRFEQSTYLDNSWWLSYSIDAAYRGKGLAKKIVTDAVTHLQQKKLVTTIKAQVKPKNVISNKVFTGLGWVKIWDIYELKKGVQL